MAVVPARTQLKDDAEKEELVNVPFERFCFIRERRRSCDMILE